MNQTSQKRDEDHAEFFRGVVDRITFRNEENGYAVVRAHAEPSVSVPPELGATNPTVTGFFPFHVCTGTHFTARGEWQQHPRFGLQFKAQAISETKPTTQEAVVRYLGSGNFKGVGLSLAQRIVDTFGEQTLEVLDKQPERLLEVPGIGKAKYNEIAEHWGEKIAYRETLLFFQSYNISPTLAHRIYGRYGERAIEITKRNPFRLARDIRGIGFHTADTIALALGVAPDAIERIAAGVRHVIQQASDEGHTFLPHPQVVEQLQQLLSLDATETIHRGIDEAIIEQLVISDNGKLYHPNLFEAEKQLAELIAERVSSCSGHKQIAPSRITELVSRPINIITDPASGAAKVIQLSQAQREAVFAAAQNSLTVITGGPGCGKTTVVQTVVRVFKQAGYSIKLAAPTGRAAQRLAEVTGCEASTIHRLLKFDPIHRAFQHDEDDPLEADAIIVDESSMIDVSLAYSLFRALRPQSKVVLVGDADQLPSVGPGLFLSDVLQILAVERVRLGQLFRQSEDSAITAIAHEINASVIPHIPRPDGTVKSDAYFLPVDDVHDAARLVERLVVEQIPKSFQFSPRDITVLSPMNQGPLGVVNLNRMLQQRLIPGIEQKPHAKAGHLSFFIGDRVCQRVNNYAIISGGVFNGDQGEVIGLDTTAQQLVVRLWDGREVEYNKDAIAQLDLAYALTIHRSQGSEVPVVVLLLHPSHHILLERQLLYTAVTRAKKLLVVVGTRRALATATRQNKSRRRYSALQERIEELLSAMT